MDNNRVDIFAEALGRGASASYRPHSPAPSALLVTGSQVETVQTTGDSNNECCAIPDPAVVMEIEHLEQVQSQEMLSQEMVSQEMQLSNVQYDKCN